MHREHCIEGYLPRNPSCLASHSAHCESQTRDVDLNNLGLMLGQRRKRWANIKPKLVATMRMPTQPARADGRVRDLDQVQFSE